MMGLADRIKPSTVHHNAGCSVGTLLQILDDDDAQVLRDALVNPDIQHVTIWRALEAEEHTISRQAIGRHRNDDCRCREAGLV